MIRLDVIAPIGALLQKHAALNPDRIAFEDGHQSATWGELNAECRAIAVALQGEALRAGDPVALLLPNSIDWIKACFATLLAGGVVVPISVDAAESEIRYRLEDSRSRFVFLAPSHFDAFDRIRDDLPNAALAISVGRPSASAVALRDLLVQSHATRLHQLDELDTPAFIVYTSGTTGKAKGVVLTLRSMLWVTAACWAPITGLGPTDVLLSALPLFHSYALNLCVLSTLAVGARTRILENWSTRRVIEELARGDVTVMPGVPTIFHYLLEEARRSGADVQTGRMRLFISAGAILSGTLNNEFEQRFGVPLLDGYGITETSTMVTMNAPGLIRVPGSCGVPLPGLATRIVEPGSLTDVPRGAEGELVVKGPGLMQGYLRQPRETRAAIDHGWYRTGDLARSDAHGFLTITGRLKELIIRGGQNIAPAEIEEIIARHPAVLDCAVVGMPHLSLGEVPVACVVLRPDQSLDAGSLLAHCKRDLSIYKVPHRFDSVSVIPRTGSGKIMRFKLREQLADVV